MLYTKPDVLSLLITIDFFKDYFFVEIGNTFIGFIVQFRYEQSLLNYLIRFNSDDVCRT